MKEEINTNNAPAAIGPYSQAMKSGNLIFVSGQIPLNPKDGSIPQSIEDQTKQSLDNLMAILKESGAGAEHILKCGIFIKDMNDFAKINEVYSTYFNKPYPARFVVEVARLPKDVLIEIDAIASL